MYDPMFMSGRQTITELHSQAQNFLFRQRSSGKLVAERGSRDVLHHQEIHALFRIKIVNGGDIGMIQFGEGQGLFVEMFASSFIGDGSRTQHLDGDFAVEVRVVSTEDHTHSPATDFLDNAVVGELEPYKRVCGQSLVLDDNISFPSILYGKS